MPEGDTLVRTANGLRPWLVGQVVTAASARQPGPRVEKAVGAEVTVVEAQGKNLLIRFSNGLEIRTHLRMHGSWHRYRPGERWRLAPSRACLVLEVPGSVCVCFDAPVVELFEQRAEALHASLSRLGPDLLKPPVDVDSDPPPAGAVAEEVEIGPALLDQRALAGIGNEVKNEVLWQAGVSPWRRVAEVDDAACATWSTARSWSSVRASAARVGRARPARSRPCPLVPVRCTSRIRPRPPRLDLRCPTCRPGPAVPDGPRARHRHLRPARRWTCRVTVGDQPRPRARRRGGGVARGPGPLRARAPTSPTISSSARSFPAPP